jgi:hypothetical protein
MKASATYIEPEVEKPINLTNQENFIFDFIKMHTPQGTTMTIMNNEWLLEKVIEGSSDAKEISILVEGKDPEEVASYLAD